MGDITRFNPVACILGLIEWDDGRLNVCEMLLEKGGLPVIVPVIAVVSENTMTKVPRNFEFTDIIILLYRLSDLELRLGRVIYQHRRKAISL